MRRSSGSGDGRLPAAVSRLLAGPLASPAYRSQAVWRAFRLRSVDARAPESSRAAGEEPARSAATQVHSEGPRLLVFGWIRHSHPRPQVPCSRLVGDGFGNPEV
jgi:hypothetical protein